MDFETEKTKSKLYAVTIITVIISLILFLFLGFYSIQKSLEELDKHTYDVLIINQNNKEQVIELLEKENRNYCDSLTKIEYETAIRGDKTVTIYCKTQDNITFTIYDHQESELITYIDEFGTRERH